MSTVSAATPSPYNAGFYADQADGSLRSARVVVPIVMELVKPASVLDVGCGLGTWLAAFAEHGVSDYLGMDGDYVVRENLKIPVERFRAADLTHPPNPGRTFDLAVCLEVAEHLPEKASQGLVQLLTTAAPVVLFSAAIPGQDGTSHINEQWPEFWQQHFAANGYVRLDPLRPRIWRDRRVEWWYQQNVYLYVRESVLPQRPVLQEEYELAKSFPFELIEVNALGRLVRGATFGGKLLGLPGAAWRSLRRWF